MNDPESAYNWLVKDKISYKYSVHIMVKQLHLAVQEKKDVLANSFAEELKSIGDELGDELERALIRLECARAIYKLGNLDAAIDELNQAIKLLKPHADDNTFHKHYYAVAEWMLGSLLKRSTSKRKEAIVAWQISLDAFKTLILSSGYFSSEKEWYSARCKAMCEQIEHIVKERTLNTQKPKTLRSTRFERLNLPISTLYSDGTKYLEVVGIIPAGGFGPYGIDPYSIEKLFLNPVMDEFVINGKSHNLYNLRKGDKNITLLSSERYFILNVFGDSMNGTFIDPGDYVLMREQTNADNGSIVAAEIVNEDNQATLKLFTRINGNIVLRPQSTNKSHKEYIFTDSGQDFYIRGIVLGVFKPVM